MSLRSFLLGRDAVLRAVYGPTASKATLQWLASAVECILQVTATTIFRSHGPEVQKPGDSVSAIIQGRDGSHYGKLFESPNPSADGLRPLLHGPQKEPI